LRCFDANSRLQSSVVADDDTGSLLATSSSLPGRNNTQLCSPSSVTVFVDQRLRLVLFAVFSLLPSLAIVIAFSTWTYTSVQVRLEAKIYIYMKTLKTVCQLSMLFSSVHVLSFTHCSIKMR